MSRAKGKAKYDALLGFWYLLALISALSFFFLGYKHQVIILKQSANQDLGARLYPEKQTFIWNLGRNAGKRSNWLLMSWILLSHPLLVHQPRVDCVLYGPVREGKTERRLFMNVWMCWDWGLWVSFFLVQVSRWIKDQAPEPDYRWALTSPPKTGLGRTLSWFLVTTGLPKSGPTIFLFNWPITKTTPPLPSL